MKARKPVKEPVQEQVKEQRKQELISIAESLTRPQMVRMVRELQPLLSEKDKVDGYPRACPGCGSSKWKTKTKSGNMWICRACGYVRNIETISAKETSMEGE
jgi:hypothetical protein